MLRLFSLIKYSLLIFAALFTLSGCGGGAGGAGNKAGLMAPTVTATIPALNASSVAINAALTATFSANMSASSPASSFTLQDNQTPRNTIQGTVSYAGSTATFKPSMPLAYLTTYSATITTAALDANNVPVTSNYPWSFTTIAVSVAVPPVATATTTAQALTVGAAMASFSPLMTSGGTTPYTYFVSSGTLPAGLSFNNITGAVTGTPTSTYTTANVVFSVKDATNTVAATTSTVNFTVGQAANYISAIATTTAQSLTVGTSMASFSPLTPSGGVAPYVYIVKSGTLPTGLQLNSVTGAVTGTPAVAQAAVSVTFGVKDANLAEANTTSTVSFTVVALPAGYVYEGGLTWMPISAKYPYSSTTTTTAAQLCAGTINGTKDWRLPTQPELSALFSSGLMNGQGWTLNYTWSSTPENSGFHYFVIMSIGYVAAANDTYYYFVTCVR